MRVALYARYSSDSQRAASIEDQLRLCRDRAQREGWTIIAEHADAAISGATMHRPGLQSVLKAATSKQADIVLAESLDRFSRDQEDTAGLFKRLTFVGVRLMTLAEGDIGALHVGFKGTMNALYLKDLGEKTHRGLEGRILAGKAAGGLAYGYRAGASIGERVIDATQSAIVTRIFEDFAGGTSPQTIAKQLNAERIDGPSGRSWGPSTLHGHAGRGTGILNNELYIGRLVWNRQRFLKDPDTGRRVARMNPQAAWLSVDVPDLRIVPDALWSAVKARQAAQRNALISDGLRGAQRPTYLFSGLMKCGACGSSYTVYSTHRLACSGCRERGICSNRLTIRRDALEQRVLSAMQTGFFGDARFELFCEAFLETIVEETKGQRESAAAASREHAEAVSKKARLIQAITDGVPAAVVKDELLAVEARLTTLAGLRDAHTDTVIEPPDRAEMASLWTEQVGQLRQALDEDGADSEARAAVRRLVDVIELRPSGDELLIRVRGDMAGMYAATSQDDGLHRQMALVAGARSRRDLALEFWVAA